MSLRNPAPTARSFWRGKLWLLLIILASSLSAAAAAPEDVRKTLEGYTWAYLRDGQAVGMDESLVELAAAGDTNLGRGVNFKTALTNTSAWLETADLAIVNLECTITQAEASPSHPSDETRPYRLIAPPEAAAALRKGGVNLVTLANNHSLDAGPDGLADTSDHLQASGIIPVGAGADQQDALQPIYQNIRGLKLAFLAFNAIPSPDPVQPGWAVARWNQEAAVRAVREAAIVSDAVIVSVHWGYEYEQRADPAQIAGAQALLSAGADLVIGHHPHVTQEIIIQQRADGAAGLAALSLGNFVFDQGYEGTQHGLALRAFFDWRGLRGVQLLPVQAGLQPQLRAPGSFLPIIRQVSVPFQFMIFNCRQGQCEEAQGESRQPSPESGVFQTGRIDLTGDRIPEEIHLQNGRLKIYEQNHLDWTSPEEWNVLDVAMGDPDADGRNDLMLALEKLDQKGEIQSHPFLIGYRGGVYRTVWGGSPVRDPVKEVELGDVDSDGMLELIVLEEEREGQGRAVTIWSWHGWGFSLDWRSRYAQFEEMAVKGSQIQIKIWSEDANQ